MFNGCSSEACIEVIVVVPLVLNWLLLRGMVCSCWWSCSSFWFVDVELLSGIFLLRLIHWFIFDSITIEIFILKFNPSQFFCVFFIFESHIFAEKDKESKTFDIVWIFLIDRLIYFQCFLEVSNSSLTRSNHQFPFYFTWFDLTSSFKIETCFFVQTLLYIVDSQPDISVKVHGQKSIRLKIVMKCLLLIILSEENISHSCQNSSVIR